MGYDNMLLFAQMSFLAVVLNSMLNIVKLDTSSTASTVALVASAISQIWAFVFMVSVIRFLLKNHNLLNEKEFRRKYNALYDGMKT